jgi:hypothetical protein
MGQLNIKSDRADELVSRLVALTGESKTQAVVAALEERLKRVEQEKAAPPARRPDYEERLRIIREAADAISAMTPPHLRHSDHADLYDENGTPR